MFTSHTDDCYRDSGSLYYGTANYTREGLACQPWAAQEPHPHLRSPQIYPILEDSANYCRNAGGEESAPWCYTMDKNTRWQLCEVPPCGEFSH